MWDFDAVFKWSYQYDKGLHWSTVLSCVVIMVAEWCSFCGYICCIMGMLLVCMIGFAVVLVCRIHAVFVCLIHGS